MSNTQTAKEILTVQDTNGNIVGQTTRTINGDVQTSLIESLAAAAVNTPFVFPFVKSRTQSFAFYSDQAITIKTNSATTPQETITLAAGSIYTWNTAHPEVNPLVGDVTALYLSNPGAVAANVKVTVLVNAA